ncbi:MAG: hypothetical protein LBE08_06715 [Bifidobacteriaceae bacterium]|jgi:ABC-type Co2+ transport system permease subunit|nr:hypothetical protein [Bifidobacteriaceae bacterium]
MRRAIARHDALMTARIAELEAARAGGQNIGRPARALATHHDRATRHFQHERLIHLLVTLFFGGLAVALVAALAAVALGPADDDPIVGLFWALAAGAAVVGVLEGFYVVHYYHLENGVQRLYRFDAQLAELTAGD